MGKASSAKKIARAARVGATTGPNERRQLGFPTLVITIIVLGLVLVAFSRSTRDAQVSPTLQDHWHNSYGIYDCQSDGFLANFQSERDPDGIHSHGEGLVHIHPFTSGVTGREAQLHVFLTNMGATLTDTDLTFPGGERLSEGVQCDGQEAVLQVLRWDNAFGDDVPPSDVKVDDLAEFRFRADGQAFVIALAPLGASIPLPESGAALAGREGESRDEGIDGTNTTAIPGPQDFGTQPDDGDDG